MSLLCVECGLPEEDHHVFYAPQPRPGCVCEIESWGNPGNIPPVCAAFIPLSQSEPTYCKNCEHDLGCHGAATTTREGT